MSEINTEEYWDNRFLMDWEAMQGKEQTEFFAYIALELLPDWLKSEIKSEKLTICDFGCALGEAVCVLNTQLQTKVSGMDFSESAVEKAKENYPQYDFFQKDISKEEIEEMRFDVGYISNVLEHIKNPWSAAKNLVKCLNRYFIVLIPFRETMQIEEHCNKFDTGNIPFHIEKMKLIYVNYMDCTHIENTLYADRQILLVYTNEREKINHSCLEDFVEGFEKEYKQIIEIDEKEKQKLENKIEEVNRQYQIQLMDNKRLTDEVKNDLLKIEQFQFEIKEYEERVNCLSEEVLRYEKETEEQKNKIIELSEQVISDKEQKIKYEHEIGKQKDKIIELKEQISLNREQKIKYECEVDRQKDKIIELKEQISLDGKQKIKYECEVREQKDEIIELKKQLELEKEQNIKYEREVNRQKKKIAGVTEQEEFNRKQIDYMKNMIYDLQIEREGTYKSFSWKITSPLRGMKKIGSNAHKVFIDKKYRVSVIRNSRFYEKFRAILPQKWKHWIKKKYLNEPEIEAILKNNKQEKGILEYLREFECNLKEDDQLILVFSGVKYIDSEGQRNIRLIHEARELGKKIIFAYWRWDTKEEIDALEENMIKIPIDILVQIKINIFEDYFKEIQDKCLLVEFPHPYVTQMIEIANSFGWKTIYDVIDDWEEFSHCGQAEWYDKKVERRVANIVDVNIATAHVLKEKIQKDILLPKPYYIITNGVDAERMKKAKQLPEYDFTKGTLQIGYFGHLTDAWFDWELIKQLAKNHMDWTFHMIGYGAPEKLRVPNNIILYGKKLPEELPKYAAYWDVAIIPFINNELTKGVNPIKVFEYLQLRLPVVASNMPEIAEYPYVSIAIGYEEFEAAIVSSAEIVMEEERVQSFIENNTWRKKCEELLKCIKNIKK